MSRTVQAVLLSKGKTQWKVPFKEFALPGSKRKQNNELMIQWKTDNAGIEFFVGLHRYVRDLFAFWCLKHFDYSFLILFF